MFPAATAVRPDSTTMAANRVVTVVLPLVPVTATSSVAGDDRHASSTSLNTGTPAEAAASCTGWWGPTPGLGTTSWAPAASPALPSVAPSRCAISAVPSSARSSTITTVQPSATRWRVTA